MLICGTFKVTRMRCCVVWYAGSEDFSSDQPFEDGVNIWCFRECFCLCHEELMCQMTGLYVFMRKKYFGPQELTL